MALRQVRRSYGISALGLDPNSATTGVWTTQFSANLISLHKAAAATVSVINIPVPKSPKMPSVAVTELLQIAIIEIFYKVSTANLTSAPTATLIRQNQPGGLGTGLVAVATISQALTFAGGDTVGTAFATPNHIAVITPTVPLPILDDYDDVMISLTMNEAATSVLDILGITVTYQ